MAEGKRVYRKKFRSATLVALKDLATGTTIPVDPENRDYILYLKVVSDGNAVVLEPDDPLPDTMDLTDALVQPAYPLALPATDADAQVESMKRSYIIKE